MESSNPFLSKNGFPEDILSEKILTKHPDPHKKGINIDKIKFEIMSRTIIDILQECREMKFKELMSTVDAKLKGKFEGSTGSYYTTVKLDLEARSTLEQMPNNRPQMIRLTS